MTMHMLPVYYTTTNTRKRKKKNKTKSIIAAELEHEKFLKRMGVKKPIARVAPVSYTHLTLPTSDLV